jgi:D-alanyl-D-alanine carboxypeptidase
MRASRFVNPNGLPGKGQYSTAATWRFWRLPCGGNFPSMRTISPMRASPYGKQGLHKLQSADRPVSGADGMKTGFICASGFNQVSSATRNGKTVVSVVLRRGVAGTAGRGIGPACSTRR